MNRKLKKAVTEVLHKGLEGIWYYLWYVNCLLQLVFHPMAVSG